MRTLLTNILLLASAFAQETISGRVVDMRDVGLPAAEVWFEQLHREGTLVRRSRTDGQGNYRIGGLPPGARGRVWSSYDGHCTNYAVAEPSMGRIDVRLQAAVTLTGTVFGDDGEPAANVSVRSMPTLDLLQGAASAATTDADGKFVLENVPLADNTVFALIPNVGIATAAVRVNGPKTIELRPVKSLSSLQITTQGLTDEQCKTVRVEMVTVDGGHMTFPAPLDRITLGATGWQSDLVPNWPIELRISAPGIAIAPSRLRLKAGVKQRAVHLTASVPEPIRWPGTVHDDEGAAAAGVTLELVDVVHGNRVTATTDAGGGFEFDGSFIPGNRVKVTVVGDEWLVDTRDPAGKRSSRLASLPGLRTAVGDTSSLAVRLMKASSLAGRVLQANGRPAAFATVELYENQSRGERPYWQRVARTTADARGHYHFPRIGRSKLDVRLQVAGRLGSHMSDPFKIDEPGSAMRRPDIELTAPIIVEGTALDPQGRPAVGAHLLGVWRDSDHKHPGGKQEVMTDSRGRFRFVGVAPSSFRIVDQNDEAVQVDVEAGQTAEVNITVE